MNSLYQIDYNIALWLNALAHKNIVLDKIAVFIAVYLVYFFAAAAILYWFTDSEKLQARKGIVLAFISFVLTRAVLVEIIRLFWLRQRPFVASQTIVELINKGSEASFPSGHASAMFAIAVAIYFYNRKLGAWLLVGAALTALGRVVVGVHYPSDVIAGALLGTIVAALLQKYLAPHLDLFVRWLSGQSDRIFGQR